MEDVDCFPRFDPGEIDEIRSGSHFTDTSVLVMEWTPGWHDAKTHDLINWFLPDTHCCNRVILGDETNNPR